MALILSSYNYNIEYRNTRAHADAVVMSRLPIPQTWRPDGGSYNVECLFFENDLPTNVTDVMVKKHTSVDPVLSRVYQYSQLVGLGWLMRFWYHSNVERMI